MTRNIVTFYTLATHAVESTMNSDNKITWQIIKDGMNETLYALSSMKFNVTTLSLLFFHTFLKKKKRSQQPPSPFFLASSGPC